MVLRRYVDVVLKRGTYASQGRREMSSLNEFTTHALASLFCRKPTEMIQSLNMLL